MSGYAYPKAGQTFECPKCSEPMRKHDGPYMVWHCLPCEHSYDTYRPTDPPPQIIEAATTPVDPRAEVREQVRATLAGAPDFNPNDLREAKKMLRRIELKQQPLTAKRWTYQVRLARLVIGLSLVRFFERLQLHR